jgi:hypothetical protein
MGKMIIMHNTLEPAFTNPELLYEKGHLFERDVRDFIFKNDCNIISFSNATKDGGFDMKFEQKHQVTGEIVRCALQCKNQNKNVGVDEVQRLYGITQPLTNTFDGCVRGYFFTTSKYTKEVNNIKIKE